ncbi:MAG: transpeptidase family protein [Paludibacter sp.]|nr:transpeptidase family protein [Paludibacter sp.]
MADKRKNIVLRFGIVYGIICLSFVAVIYKIAVIQFVERDQWMALAAQSKKTDIVVKPNRGNIYACDGRLMASSIPTYYVYMDLRVPALHEKGGILFKENIDSVAIYLSSFFKDKTAFEYKTTITKAYNTGKGEFQLFPKRISYAQLKQLKTFPLFCMGRNKSGLITKELLKRVKPFGSLASRTIGDIYADETKGGKNGIELFFNQQLLGTSGVSIRQKVANTYMETVQVEPIDGMDITSTIDIDLQDIAEKALLDSLRSFDAGSGYVILMETHSGEVKAIVNMQQNADKTYSENKNGAVSDLVEPGSTFKVASLMVALDDNKVKITDSIDTGNGVYEYGTAKMKDHNAHKGGYHTISVANVIHASSNVGISKIITRAYGHKPSEFVDKLYEMKLNERMDLEIPGTAAPQIDHPNDKSKYWSQTKLPWMSIGYETQIPPIYTLAFYNAIANNGKLIKPFFVKSISKNGQLIQSFETETIKESICKPTTLRDIREVLLGVIEGKLGTAHNMKSKYVRIAGKTGTAQISKGALGYKSGGKTHQVSFCGYFPADDPQYTCIVVIREPRIGYPSGGKMAGSVFKNVAERVMALKSNRKPNTFEVDTILKFPLNPYTKSGYYKALQTVMTELKLPIAANPTEWIKSTINEKEIRSEAVSFTGNKIPDLTGMGAKDAVYLAERMGLYVRVQGHGKVISQNLTPGTVAKKGSMISINLQ